VRANPKSVRLGDLLIELVHLRDADLRAALAAQAAASERRKLGEILVEGHFITEQKLTDVLGDLPGIEAVAPRVSEVEPTLLARLNLRMCQEGVLIPIVERDGIGASPNRCSAAH
jgi:type IV pilus assembly protein PilB